jgi:hypothetical protein
MVMEGRQSAVAAFDSRRGTLKGLGMLRRPRFPPASTSEASCRVIGGLSNVSCTAANACTSLALRRGQRVRDTWCCQYISGNNCSAPPLCHIGVMATCCTSCHPLCHHTSTRADTPASCLWTLSTAFCLAGNPCVAMNAGPASISACNRRSTAWDVWGVEWQRRHGCTSSDTVSRGCRYALCTLSQRSPSAAHASPSACARGASALLRWGTWHVGRDSRAWGQACRACRRGLHMASE